MKEGFGNKGTDVWRLSKKEKKEAKKEERYSFEPFRPG